MRPMPRRPGLRSVLRVLGRRAPRMQGALLVEGILASIEIARDRWAIPHVTASSSTDAWFGLGFCHGQDRGFQLELLLRAGRGTLSELLGAGTLRLDRLSRTLGFARLAAAQGPRLDPDVFETLEAYVAGINAAARVTPLPHELALLRGRRTSWQATDVLAFLGLQSLALSANWDTEVARLRILMTDGPSALAAVDHRYADWLPVVTPSGAVAGPGVDRLAEDIALLGSVAGGGASNAWALAGSRTASGAPILANDPHLGPSVPAPWYLAHVRTPDWAVAGASFVGGPAFPSGHNGHAAWGITAGCTDSSDLFVEELDLTAGTARGPDGPDPITRIREEIAVRRAPSVVEEVIVTPRGPVITPLLEGLSVPLSLRATWLEPVPVRGLLDVVGARDFETFRSAFSAWPGPALNVAYADRDGHIGWQLIGTVPRRRGANGTLPAPAWEAAWDDGHLPFAAMPWCLDPDVGWVATSNNAPRADEPSLPDLGGDWLDGYRAAAISTRLGERRDWDVATTAALQVDTTSIPWTEVSEVVLATEPHSAGERLALALLRAWDGVVGPGSAAASVFELFVAELAGGLAKKAAPGSWRLALGEGIGEAIGRTAFGARTVSGLVATLRDGRDHQQVVGEALRSAVATLRRDHGGNPRRWAWGRVRPLRLRHALGGTAPFDRMLNLGPVAVGGDTNTIAQAGVQPLRPTDNPAAIANHRMVIDLGDVERSRFVIAGGQSGNPLSPHYDDLFALWLRGDGIPIAWSPESVAAAAIARLTLQPAGSSHVP